MAEKKSNLKKPTPVRKKLAESKACVSSRATYSGKRQSNAKARKGTGPRDNYK